MNAIILNPLKFALTQMTLIEGESRFPQDKFVRSHFERMRSNVAEKMTTKQLIDDSRTFGFAEEKKTEQLFRSGRKIYLSMRV